MQRGVAPAVGGCQSNEVLFKNVPIGQRILLGFSIPLIAIAIIGASTLRNLSDVQNDATWVSHTLEVLNELKSFVGSASALESAGWDYAVSGNPDLKETIARERVTTERFLQQLRKLTADNGPQTQRVDREIALFEQHRSLIWDVLRIRDTEQDPARGTARSIELLQQGQKISRAMRDLADEMSRVETTLLETRRVASARAVDGTRGSVVWGSLASLVMVMAGGYALSRSITQPLETLRRGAVRIGEGDYAHRVTVGRNDEVGHLASVFNAMAEQVEKRQAAIAEQEWLKTAVADFSTYSNQQRDPAKVCETLLREFTKLLQAQASVVYRVPPEGTGNQLVLVASYAAHNPPSFVSTDSGLTGQVMKDRRRILLTDTAPDFLRVTSALGETKPVTVLVEPVLFENRVKAVIELAALKPFTPVQLELARQLAASLGIVLQTIESVTRTEELLEESQALAKKLEEQQRVLANTNAELEEQADHLRRSEQLLQDQQVELAQTNEELEQSNEELQQSNEEMEEKSNLLAQQKRELEKTNRDIERTRDELQEQSRQLALTSKYKSDFLATMSHELRTPLNSLLILARLLAENRDQNLTAKQIQFAQTIASSGADLLELINQILDLARIESGKVEIQVEQVDVAELAQAMEQQFRALAESKKLGFEVHCDPSLPKTISTDGRHLGQVIRNLLANAFKFTSDGSVQLDIRPVKEGWKKRSPSLDRAAEVIAITVTDTGIGIAREKQDIIFESFQQADAGTSRRYGGTGLGLSISREIANMLGGVLQLDSELGKGSSFTLFLPAVLDTAALASKAEQTTPPAPTAKTASESPEVRGASSVPADADPVLDLDDSSPVKDDRFEIGDGDRSLLIIEDDERFANILMDFAHERRFKVLVAATARSAFALALRFRPAAITLDLRLVDEDGWVILDRLKHDQRTRHIPVHVISAAASRDRGLRLGAVSYLQKPVSKESIQKLLQETIDFIERPVRNLLVVEDDPVQRDSIRELIGNGDVKITAVGDAASAMKELASKRYDCIVMDLILPDQPGAELIREINRTFGLQAPPVIVFTGKDLSQAEETELRSLSESIIVKDARSPERLLDETALFLHRMEARLPETKRRMLEQVRRQDALLTGRRVLIVDDDARNIFALTAALEVYGMIVKFAESGRAAINTLDAEPDFDVVLMDVMMPEMNGLEAIQILRKDPRFTRLPIISLTAKAMKGDRERCIEAGASDYVTKPVDTDKLVSLLRVWLYR